MDASRFLATTLWICTEQNVTVGVPERERRRSRERTMSSHHAPSIFARRVNLERENKRVWLKGVLVEQKSEVRVAGVRHELIGDVRNMISGLLEE